MEEKEIQEVVQEQPQTAQKTKEEGTDLNITDLAALRSIIDVASQRGTFKAGELEAVGKIYNKLNTFIESVAKRD
jgi:hypothetical protein